jgi:hypothetical protein
VVVTVNYRLHLLGMTWFIFLEDFCWQFFELTEQKGIPFKLWLCRFLEPGRSHGSRQHGPWRPTAGLDLGSREHWDLWWGPKESNSSRSFSRGCICPFAPRVPKISR